jgi:hypothetical protein
MGRYLIQDTTSKAIKKSLKKWGEFPIDNSSVRGTVTIKNYRQYQFRNEVDIEFKGEIFVRVSNENRTWYDSKIMTCGRYKISKVKLNRFLRKAVLQEVRIRMNYFGVNIKEYQNVNKIKWT